MDRMMDQCATQSTDLVSQGDQEETAAKKIRLDKDGSDNETRYMELEINRLKEKLKTEKSCRAYYEEKSQKLSRKLQKNEDLIVSMKNKSREGSMQRTDTKLEQLKSRLLVRVGDIEKDTIEMKAAVAAELKKLKVMKEPLENATSLVDFLQSELKEKGIKIEFNEDTFKLLSDTRQDFSFKDETNNSILHPDKGIVNKAEKSMREIEMNNARLSEELEKLSYKNSRLKDTKMRLKEDYDHLERYLNKVEKKHETKEAQCADLQLEKKRFLAEIEISKDFKEREFEQTRVLKHESMLLKDSIAEKDAKLSRLELQLRLLKEEYGVEASRSVKMKVENLKKEVAYLKYDLDTANMKIDTLHKDKNKLEIQAENLKMENYAFVRRQNTEMEKVRKTYEGSRRDMEKKIKALEKTIENLRSGDNNNDVSEEDTLKITGNCDATRFEKKVNREKLKTSLPVIVLEDSAGYNISADIIEEIVSQAVV